MLFPLLPNCTKFFTLCHFPVKATFFFQVILTVKALFDDRAQPGYEII